MLIDEEIYNIMLEETSMFNSCKEVRDETKRRTIEGFRQEIQNISMDADTRMEVYSALKNILETKKPKQ